MWNRLGYSWHKLCYWYCMKLYESSWDEDRKKFKKKADYHKSRMDDG